MTLFRLQGAESASSAEQQGDAEARDPVHEQLPGRQQGEDLQGGGGPPRVHRHLRGVRPPAAGVRAQQPLDDRRHHLLGDKQGHVSRYLVDTE